MTSKHLEAVSKCPVLFAALVQMHEDIRTRKITPEEWRVRYAAMKHAHSDTDFGATCQAAVAHISSRAMA